MPSSSAAPYRWLPCYIWPPRDDDPVTISFEVFGFETRFRVPRTEMVVVPGHNGVDGRVRVTVNGKSRREGFVSITIASARGPRTEELMESRLSDFP